MEGGGVMRERVGREKRWRNKSINNRRGKRLVFMYILCIFIDEVV